MYNPPLTLFQKVQKGTAWLHANAPSWRTKVNKDKLNLRLWSSCILGQVLDHQTLGKLITGKEKTFLEDHGFCVMSEEENQVFIKEWKEIC